MLKLSWLHVHCTYTLLNLQHLVRNIDRRPMNSVGLRNAFSTVIQLGNETTSNYEGITNVCSLFSRYFSSIETPPKYMSSDPTTCWIFIKVLSDMIRFMSYIIYFQGGRNKSTLKLLQWKPRSQQFKYSFISCSTDTTRYSNTCP